MIISNHVWDLRQISEKVKYFKKPKFNRDLMWDIIPTSINSKKKKKANFKEYILFLIKTKNSVFPLSLGSHIINNKEFWYVIDGNNRINAIITFLDNPFKIFSEYYVILFDYIDNINNEKITKEHKTQIKITIEKFNYRKLSTFNRLDDNLHEDLLDLLDRKNLKEIENRIIEIQQKLRSKDGTPFDTSIEILVNDFKHGTDAEHSELFHDINKYTNTFSLNQIYAARLFEVIIVIKDFQLKCEILNKVKDYYDNRGQNEVVEKYQMELDFNKELSAYDFMVGFQNLCSEKYKIIGKFTHDGTSLFFKIFNNLYGSTEKNVFTEYNINDFINKITFSCEIIENAFKLIMPENINNRYFSPQLNGINSKLIPDNAMVVIFISNIVNINKLSKKEIINKNRCILIYHLLCDKKYLKDMNDDNFKFLKLNDKLNYQAGGNYIDNICAKILNGEDIFTISKNQMSYLLKEILKCSYINRLNNISSSKKRRTLNLFDKILISTYWYVNMSKFYVNQIFETEHISPFSSTCDGEIDIDRIGNLFPTLENINSKRGNKNLEIYYKEENKGFTNFIANLLPSNYDEINIRDGKKNCINSIEKYNEYCKNNEELYLKTLLDNLFTN
jgi:hypothetical protein